MYGYEFLLFGIHFPKDFLYQITLLFSNEVSNLISF